MDDSDAPPSLSARRTMQGGGGGHNSYIGISRLVGETKRVGLLLALVSPALVPPGE